MKSLKFISVTFALLTIGFISVALAAPTQAPPAGGAIQVTPSANNQGALTIDTNGVVNLTDALPLTSGGTGRSIVNSTDKENFRADVFAAQGYGQNSDITSFASSGAKTANHTGWLMSNSSTSSTASITKTGLDIQSTGVWNGASAINIGLNVNVTGGTTNYAAIFQGGNVGIGTTAVGAKLTLADHTANTGGIRFRTAATAVDLWSSGSDILKTAAALEAGSYRVGTTEIITSGRVLRVTDGTVSAPGLSFSSDTNVGIYRGGTDILKFVTAGVDRLTINASGDTIIGGHTIFSNGQLRTTLATGSDFYYGRVSGETTDRFRMHGNTTNGFTLNWGDGAVATDTNLYRSAISTLKTDGAFVVGGALTVASCTGCGGGGAPVGASYITKTADTTLTGEFALSTLGTGLLKNTTTTGDLSIAVAGTDYVAPGGNVATATALAANGTNCTAGQYAQGVDASGNAEGCTAAGTGTVTSVSVTTANGVSGTVANSTTTPAISLTLGAITPTTVNGLTLAAQAVGFTIAGGTTSKTLTVNNTLAFSGTDATTMTFPSTSGTVMTLGAAQTVTGAKTFSSSMLLLAGSTSGTTTLNASAAASGTLTLPAATDTLVGKATTDTLTNKTITATSNNVAAKSLHSATTVIDVSASTAPAVGQVLTATSSTAATWQNNPSGWTVSGSNTILATSTNNVGIGLTPIAKLHVQGNASPGGNGGGTVTTSTGSGTPQDQIVQGSLTQFGTDVKEGDTITISGQTRTVVRIEDTDTLYVDAPFSPQITLATTAWSYQRPIMRGYNDAGATRLNLNSRGLLVQGSGTDNESISLVLVDGNERPRVFFADNGHLGMLRKPESGSVIAIDGGATATGTWQDNSDSRLKENINKISNVLENIKNINGVYYDWKIEEFPEKNFDPSRQLGLIAQEVEKVFPEIVSYDDEGYRSLAYGRFVAVLLEAIKEQQKEIENQAKTLNDLKKDVEMLKKSIKK